VLGILDVLVAGITALMASDELGIEVDADTVGIGLNGQPAMRVSGGNRIVIGVDGDAELTGGSRGRGARNIIDVWIEVLQALFFKQIDGPPMRLTVDAHIGDGVEPDLCGGLDGTELAQLQAAQEVLLDEADSRFHAPLLIGARDVAGRDGKTVVASKIEIAWIEQGCDAGEALQDGRLQIVDHDL
jgi:hypothetical protein